MVRKARPGRLWHLSLPVSSESEDAVREALFELFGVSPSVYYDAETRASSAHVYLPSRPASKELEELSQALERVRAAGLALPRQRFALKTIRKEDWAESWKRHFKPLMIRRRLVIRPSWIRKPAPKGCAVVVLDPGLSFGTGQHPTTRFCLEQLVAHRKTAESQSFLDIGTGSGILAVAAAKLGYCPVDAIEIDPQAVRIASLNARKNRVDQKLNIICRDLNQFRSKDQYDLVCANLIFDLLIDVRRKLIQCVKPSGALVVAGILRTQMPRVLRAFTESGAKLISRHAEAEWESAALVRKR